MKYLILLVLLGSTDAFAAKKAHPADKYKKPKFDPDRYLAETAGPDKKFVYVWDRCKAMVSGPINQEPKVVDGDKVIWKCAKNDDNSIQYCDFIDSKSEKFGSDTVIKVKDEKGFSIWIGKDTQVHLLTDERLGNASFSTQRMFLEDKVGMMTKDCVGVFRSHVDISKMQDEKK